MTDKDRERGSQGRQGSGATDRDQASNIGSGFNEEASMKGRQRGENGQPR